MISKQNYDVHWKTKSSQFQQYVCAYVSRSLELRVLTERRGEMFDANGVNLIQRVK